MHTAETNLEYRPNHINYPENRKGYEVPKINFSWRSSELGQLAMIILHFFQEDRIRTINMANASKYGELGINRKTTEELLRSRLPEVFDEYERSTGNPLTGGIIMGRLYMWYLKHVPEERKCVRMVSPEHPMVWGPKSGLCEKARKIYLGLERYK